MTDTSSIPSVTDRVKPVDAGAPVVAAHFIGGAAVFVLGEETLLFAENGATERFTVHGGGILASASDGKRDFVSDTSIVADRYEVQVDDDVADEAERLLGAMPGGR